MTLLDFLHALESDITAQTQADEGRLADYREPAFTQIMAEELETAGTLESPEVCHLERGKAGAAVKISGYGVPDDDDRLDLFVTIYNSGPHEEVPKLNAQELEMSFKKLERYLEHAFNGLQEKLDVAMPEHSMTSHIARLKGKVDRVNFMVFTNCQLVLRREKERKKDVSGLKASYEVYDIERLRRLRESGSAYEPINVPLEGLPKGGLPCVILDGAETGYRTCVAIFPGEVLRDLYDEYGSRLIELNVRSYLQARGKVNSGILKTLEEAPADFMAYNNGITVVAEKIRFGKGSDGGDIIQELQGMQIVNGGQTTASIHRASKGGRDLSKVFVQGKVVTIDPSRFAEVVPLISRYANSQNKVTEPDLQSNHPFHVGIERVSRREWSPDQSSMWFYERARGSFQTLRQKEGNTPAKLRVFDKKYPTSQRFTKEDLAKFENCWLGLPHIVNRGAQKNFTQFMTRVKEQMKDLPEGWEPSAEEYRNYVAKVILYRDVQLLVRRNSAISAYRVNVTNFTAAMLAERSARRIDLTAIWRNQSIGKDLRATAESWSLSIFQAMVKYGSNQGKHIDTVLKSEELWHHLIGLELELSDAIEKNLVEVKGINIPKNPLVSAVDHDNAARCRELSAEQWMRIIQWGGETNELQDWQVEIASTLSGYAALHWRKSPSSKQAKHGAMIVAAARAAGIL